MRRDVKAYGAFLSAIFDVFWKRSFAIANGQYKMSEFSYTVHYFFFISIEAF